ncbi:VCBS repeat-containing protein [Shewanella mesophila]|uniref:FG-GAP repeat domain-containing protein n=1 Tax=Shewanella mesophila TaxID=2864208 RepID=UPI001C6591A2|nr:VCBS repeat-containing protein [Shewanella mesophila]QYJ86682.1 VCBS repeat-containing protein [Shewanella mesophila]
MRNAKIGLEYIVGSLLLLLSSSAIGASINSQLSLFSQTIETGFRLTHPVLPVNLFGDATKELVAIGVDENQARWLAIYGFDLISAQYKQQYKQALPRELFAFDITPVDDDHRQGLQSLYFLSSEQLLKLDVTGELLAFKSLMSISPLIMTSRPDFISRGRFVHDLNKDGLDDFVISGLSQAELLIQQADTSLLRQFLPIKPQVLLYRDGAKYIEADLYFADLNLDGRNDIVKVAEGELELYAQQSDGTVSTIAKYLPVSLAISGLDWWNKRDAYGEALDQSDLIYRKVELLKDVNNDGLVDMVVRYTKSSGVLDRVNDYELYLGEKKAQGVTFGRQPSNVIRADGTLTGFELVDIDDDNIDEVLVSGFDIGLSQIIGALVSGSIDQDVYLFKMNANGQFPKKANINKEVELSFSLTSGQSGSPIVKLIDLDGDGYQDLLLSDGEESLRVYLGRNDSDLFSRDSETLKVRLPSDGEMLSDDDLNHDGRSELIINYGRQDSQSLQSQFIVIMAK